MLSLFIALQTLVGERVDDVRARRDAGATAVEYGIMVALIAVAIIVTVRALGVRLNELFGQVRDALP